MPTKNATTGPKLPVKSLRFIFVRVAARRQAQWLAWGHVFLAGPKRVLESGRWNSERATAALDSVACRRGSGRRPSTLACPNAVNAAPGTGQHVLHSLNGDAIAKNGMEDFHLSIA